MVEQLPPMFINSFENKVLTESSSKINKILMQKKQKDTVKLNRKFM